MENVREIKNSRELVKDEITKSDFLAALSGELKEKISPEEANEILALARKNKKYDNAREKAMVMAKEMTDNWYMSIGKYSRAISYDENDNKGTIEWDAKRLSYSLGFKKFSNGQAVIYGDPFVLDNPIQESFKKMNSWRKSTRQKEFKSVEEKFFKLILPIVTEFENSNEVEIEFNYKRATSFVNNPDFTEGSAWAAWNPTSWSSETKKEKITKEDFMKNYKRGFIDNVKFHNGSYEMKFITLDQLKKVTAQS